MVHRSFLSRELHSAQTCQKSYHGDKRLVVAKQFCLLIFSMSAIVAKQNSLGCSPIDRECKLHLDHHDGGQFYPTDQRALSHPVCEESWHQTNCAEKQELWQNFLINLLRKHVITIHTGKSPSCHYEIKVLFCFFFLSLQKSIKSMH